MKLCQPIIPERLIDTCKEIEAEREREREREREKEKERERRLTLSRSWGLEVVRMILRTAMTSHSRKRDTRGGRGGGGGEREREHARKTEKREIKQRLTLWR